MAYEWFTKKETGHDNCKIYRMNDLKQKKLASVAIHGIIQHPEYVIEVLGAREKKTGALISCTIVTLLDLTF